MNITSNATPIRYVKGAANYFNYNTQQWVPRTIKRGIWHGFWQTTDGDGHSEPVALVEDTDGKVYEMSPKEIQFIEEPRGYEVEATNDSYTYSHKSCPQCKSRCIITHDFADDNYVVRCVDQDCGYVCPEGHHVISAAWDLHDALYEKYAKTHEPDADWDA